MGNEGAGWRAGGFGRGLLVAALALSTAACGAHGGAGAPQAPMGHFTVTKTAGPEDAPEEAKTVTVEYTFDRDVVNKDFDKTFNDGFEKKGLKVDEQLTAHAHFDVKDAKITGTVTYVKKGMGHYSILEADLVATGHYDADVQVEMDVQVKGDTKNAKDGDWDKTLIGGKPVPLVKNVMPTNIPIAGPLFLHAHFDLSAACDMQVEGQMHAITGVGISGDVRLAAKYKKAGFDMPDGKKSKFQFESKAPSFELSPRPYLKVEGKQQRLKGRCSLQPTAVLLLEHSVGAKLSVEPYVELEAKRASARDKWTLDAQAGVSVSAATDIEIFGRQVRKAKEYALFDVTLTKPGDEMGTPPRIVGPAVPPKTGRAAKVEVASVLGAGLGSAREPAAVAEKASMPRAMRGVFGRKKKL
ncbi:MAG: hypothetical protein JWO86_7009 [Myxococcaceae bacterium]|nr:hypothetical protein [Myxococcaceae bacterium]MEA2749995.1 hypothetical protein [Myxococcales bacterium]